MVYVSKQQLLDPRFLNTDIARHQPFIFLSRFVVELTHAFRITGAAICYFGFLLVCVCSETLLSENGTISTSILGCLQFSAMILLVGVHIVNYVNAPRTFNYLRVDRTITSVLETLILAVRYLYHFDAIPNFLDLRNFASSYLSAHQFGLKFQDTISHIFMYLLMTAILLFYAFGNMLHCQNASKFRHHWHNCLTK